MIHFKDLSSTPVGAVLALFLGDTPLDGSVRGSTYEVIA